MTLQEFNETTKRLGATETSTIWIENESSEWYGEEEIIQQSIRYIKEEDKILIDFAAL